jgi:hypothetical protein
MSKIYKSVLRRDLHPDHSHSLPDGTVTGGMLGKPNANSRAGWHTHLYMHDGMVQETDAAYEGGDHVHDVPEFGMVSSGPQPAQNYAGEPMSRTDRMDADEAEAISHVRGDVDEGLWNKAKRASQEAFGKIKWPFVTYWYEKQGGS